MIQKLYKLTLVLPALLIIFIIRLLRPFITIRFALINGSRIGHLAADIEVYLCERQAGLYGKRNYDVFCYTRPICNHQLAKMWKRSMHISSFVYLVSSIIYINRFLPGYKRHEIKLKNRDRDINGLYGKLPTHLHFNDQERNRARLEMGKMFLPEKAAYICLHARDSAYLDTMQKNDDWRYHDYRDISISNYLPMTQVMAKRGYFIVRMGAIVKEPLDSRNPKVIDYALKYRSDFLDIYLSAKCEFFIGCGSGIDSVAAVFRRPVVYANYIPLEYVPTWSPYFLFIPKKLWLRKENRFMTFREIINTGIGRWLHSERYDQAGIDIIENTPEEITDVVVETDERLKGVWKETDEDVELQRRFWSLFKPGNLHGKIAVKIGAGFLRENRGLLN